MSDLKQAPKQQALQKPAPRWRNLYRALQDWGLFSLGEEHWGDFIWPSKDLAESAVHEAGTAVVAGLDEYLGAFPWEGE